MIGSLSLVRRLIPCIALALLVIPARAVTISKATYSQVAADAVQLEWTTDVAAACLVEYGKPFPYDTTTPVETTPAVSHSARLTGLQAGHECGYHIRAVDANGNEIASLNGFFWMPQFDLNLWGISYPDTHSATIQWSTNRPATSQIDYGPTADYGTTTPVDANRVAAHTMTLTGLSRGIQYHYRLRSTDGFGVEAVSCDFTFQIPSVRVSKPVVTQLDLASAKIEWTTAEPTVCAVDYGLTSAFGASTPPDAAPSTAHSATLKGLATKSQYVFRFRMTDAEGIEQFSKEFSFQTPTIAIDSESITFASATSVKIRWNTSIPVTSQIDYGLTDSYGSKTPENPFLAIAREMTITGLIPGATYHFRLRGVDGSGNEALSSDYTFAMPDATIDDLEKGWILSFHATSDGSACVAGSLQIGVMPGAKDCKDTCDALQAPLPLRSISLRELRNDWSSNPSGVAADIRAPYTNGTKIWSNCYLSSDADAGSTHTLSWDVGYGPLPAGSYSMIVQFAPGVTDPDGKPLDDATKVYNIGVPGSLSFVSAESGAVQASITLVCKIGNGPVLHGIAPVTTSAGLSSPINCAPIVDENGFAYFGSDLSQHIYKVNALAIPASAPARLSDPAVGEGNVRGRMACYGGFAYGVTDAGRVVKRNMAGTSVGNWAAVVGANVNTIPAVTGDGTVYIGAGDRLRKLNADGMILATSPALPGAVGSASIPGTDRIWVNAGNSIVCLNSELTMVQASVDLGAPVGPPTTRPGPDGRVIVTAGSSLVTLSATTMGVIATRSADGVVDGTPFVDPAGNVIFATATHKLYKGSVWDDRPLTSISLPGAAGPIKGSVIVGANWTAIAGGGDQNVYLVNNTTGQATFLGVNQDTLGCSTDLNGHIYFTSTDGNLYVIE